MDVWTRPQGPGYRVHMSTPRKPTSKTRRVTDDLRRRILSGEYAPGARIPALTEISTRYEVSINVARSAVSTLASEGLVETTGGGGGTRVRQTRPTRRYGIDRYRRSVWGGTDPRPILTAEAMSQGREASQVITRTGEAPAPEWVAGRLQIDTGDPVWVRARRTSIDSDPSQILISYFPEWVTEAAPRLREQSTGPGGTFARLDEISHLGEVSEVIEARMPTTDERSELSVPPGVPVLEVTRVIYDHQDRPMEVAHGVLRADMALFAYRFPILE